LLFLATAWRTAVTSNVYINWSTLNDSSLSYIYKEFLGYSVFEGAILCRFDTSRQTDHLPYSTCNEGQPRRPTISIKPFKAQWSIYVPPVLKFTNYTFCPQIVFICFVWIKELTAIISLYSPNWLFIVTEMGFVYCEVRNGYWNKYNLV